MQEKLFRTSQNTKNLKIKKSFKIMPSTSPDSKIFPKVYLKIQEQKGGKDLTNEAPGEFELINNFNSHLDNLNRLKTN